MKRKIGSALVVGAGISGIRAALDLAEFGYGVTLIDRAPHLGGILSQLDYQFPTDRCGMCKMLPMTDRDASSQYCLRKGLFHENIEILVSTEISYVEGEPGNFQVMLQEKSAMVDPDLCIGCGCCTDVCPVEVPDDFNKRLGSRKAIYLPVPHAIPNPYIIDLDNCTRCGECEKICPTNAVRLSLSQQERKKFRILVVDDELIVRDSLSEWLDDAGFTADMAGSGQEALTMLAEESYHLMLLDIKMPGMDGTEVLRKAKEDFPDISVVMMTAYATVETAVEAMKTGALDYLMKPFDPDILVPKILQIYQGLETAKGRKLEVGAIVLCGGTSFFDPGEEEKNIFGHGVYPNVLTSPEFERILSNTGPYQGRLIRPGDSRPVSRIAWIQCVGSRDLQTDADFCSNICCMYAIKEALVAKEKAGNELETAIFYMDMRTFGKSFQRYRDHAEKECGVRFVRGRIHSLVQDESTGDLLIRYADHGGAIHDDTYDMIVLAVGQRPAPGTSELAEMLETELNPWGFVRTEPFSLVKTNREGILTGGSFSGSKDISESVIQASAAALNASRVICAAGGNLALEPEASDSPVRDVSRELPRILAVVCTCGETFSQHKELISSSLEADPCVAHVAFIEQTCTARGWESLVEIVRKNKPNRVLIGACLPYVYARKTRELGKQAGLDPALMEVVDIRSEPADPGNLISTLQMGISRLRYADPCPVPTIPVFQQALVAGGGIAGMTAALAIADHGFKVDILEQGETLGGNLSWLRKTIEGYDTNALAEELPLKLEKHPLINVHTGARLAGSYGQAGCFHTSFEEQDGKVQTLEHGVTILATGGTEAPTTSYCHGESDAVLTQKEFEHQLDSKSLDPARLDSLVMIQCVDSREEPRNYCSRVCCASCLKMCLYLKEKNPDVTIYVLYRDMMAYGFAESYYTEARKAGVIFIQYDVDRKPDVSTAGGSVRVSVFEPIISREVEIETDLLILATGVIPNALGEMAEIFGAKTDQDGFFQEAESKWRPVDSLKEGVFACGMAHSPRSITETIATAEAAAQRCLRILDRKQLPAGKVVAKIRHSICSLCERCIETCPYGARFLDSELEQVRINAVMCQGCGACAAVCPNSASILEGFPIHQMLDVIDAALGMVNDEGEG